MRVTFDSDHVERIINESEAAMDGRRGTFAQNYDPKFLKRDLTYERMLEIKEELEDGLSFVIDPNTEIDDKRIPAGVWLVGDHGIYLMSNAATRKEEVAYADQANPKTMSADDCWTAKNDIFGGDDGVDFLDPDVLRKALVPGGKIALHITPEAISVEIPPQKEDDGPAP
ncbi:MAG: DUF3085 domain-containing protein [Roseibium sp.]|uniref:DUF3085 domain-containing protein n=1 Tax=Roseibium sp. TaxID=1936156 RepID=UPI003297A704